MRNPPPNHSRLLVTPVRRVVLAVVAGLAVLAAGCRPGGVLVTFRPEAGADYDYRIEVASSSVVEVDGRPAEREHDRVTLRARHEVLSTGPRGTRVEVRLQAADDENGPPRTFVVTLDRSARLAEIERIENVPAAALGELGPSEIFPAAAGAPPDRSLRPGARWDIDEEVQLPAGTVGRLRGHGRVAALRVVDGTKAAVITVELTLVVQPGPDSALAGTQTTTSRSVHAVADGSVIESRSETLGSFTVKIPPPDGEGEPIRARLTVDVMSTTRLSST